MDEDKRLEREVAAKAKREENKQGKGRRFTQTDMNYKMSAAVEMHCIGHTIARYPNKLFVSNKSLPATSH